MDSVVSVCWLWASIVWLLDIQNWLRLLVYLLFYKKRKRPLTFYSRKLLLYLAFARSELYNTKQLTCVKIARINSFISLPRKVSETRTKLLCSRNSIRVKYRTGSFKLQTSPKTFNETTNKFLQLNITVIVNYYEYVMSYHTVQESYGNFERLVIESFYLN